jgi:hypothetical protein
LTPILTRAIRTGGPEFPAAGKSAGNFWQEAHRAHFGAEKRARNQTLAGKFPLRRAGNFAGNWEGASQELRTPRRAFAPACADPAGVKRTRTFDLEFPRAARYFAREAREADVRLASKPVAVSMMK